MKRAIQVFLLCVITVSIFSACASVQPEPDSPAVVTDEELDRLEALYKGAIRVPITPQIVAQVRKENKEHLLKEIRYYTSVNIVLVHDGAGVSSIDLETPGLRENQDVLTFREGGPSLNQSRISRDEEGRLAGAVSQEGDTFEISYPGHPLILGFVLNHERNWYDLEFAAEETGGERIPLAMSGARPHLLINYQAFFPDTSETRIQFDNSLDNSVNRLAPRQPVESYPADGQDFALPQDSYILPPGFHPVEIEGVDRFAGETGGAILGEFPAAEVFPENGYAYPESFAAEPPPPGEPPVPEAPPPSGELVLVENGDYSPEVVLVLDDPGANTGGNPAPGNAGYYTVQVGAFQDQKNAAAAYTALERGGFAPCYEYHQSLTRVVIPAVAQKDLSRTREKIRALGFSELYVRQ
jgi:hypothetical protein